MSSWRTFGIGAAVIGVTAAVGARLTSVEVVAPPVVAALGVLVIAAISVDYFGIVRRHAGWAGRIQPSATSRAMVGALERRFARERASGAIRTGATARALLISLAEHGELRRAGDVCDFLATEAATLAHADVVADALRAIALVELGRAAEARVVVRGLGSGRRRVRGEAGVVVGLARARIAEAEGELAAALAAARDGLGDAPRIGPARELGLARARLAARSGRLDEAREEMARLVRDGGRSTIEALAAGAEAAVAMVARDVLGLAAVYR